MKNNFILLPLLFLASLQLHRAPAQAQSSCTGETFSGNRLFATCSSLPYLGATLHWTYHPANGTVDVAYRAPQSASGWVAWAINPSGPRMPGANAFLAFPDAATGAVTLWTTRLSSYTPTVRNESLEFPVHGAAAEYAGGAYTIYATVGLPGNRTSVNVVWQASTQFQDGAPYGHQEFGDNENSKGTLDLASGAAAVPAGGANSRVHRENIHGVLNAVSWGIMMPIGGIIARYLRVFPSADPTWFYLHATCQLSAFFIGAAGFGLGLKLGAESVGIVHHKHRNIGVALFCLAALQVFALLLRPDKKNKYRIYWNVYHHTVGYFVIVLSAVNIFKGFDILHPADKWKHAYVYAIVLLTAVALVLEVFTWIVVLRRRSPKTSQKLNQSNGA